jgi:hypothetical protein
MRPLRQNLFAFITLNKVIFAEINKPATLWRTVTIPPLQRSSELTVDDQGNLWRVAFRSGTTLEIQRLTNEPTTITINHHSRIIVRKITAEPGSALFIRTDDDKLSIFSRPSSALYAHGRWFVMHFLNPSERTLLHTYKEKYMENIYTTNHIFRVGRLAEYDSQGRFVRWLAEIEAIMPDDWKNLPDTNKYSHFAPWTVDREGNLYFSKLLPDRTEVWMIPNVLHK